uniref:Uncharacterized protein n=1 Tax=Zea mays TaxID=4577 RepID=B4FM94_MAIZE|nr:unknown [Zea mays]
MPQREATMGSHPCRLRRPGTAQCPVGACYVLNKMRSKPRVVDFLQQPRHLRALPARCFIKRSEQHAVDTRRVFAVFAQPHPRRRRNPC